MRVLDEKTFVPISMLLAIASFAFWLSTVSNQTEANAKAVDALALKAETDFVYVRDQRQKYDGVLADRMREQDKVLREMTDRLGRIEGKLDSLKRSRD